MDDSFFPNDRKTVRVLRATAHFIRLNQIRPPKKRKRFLGGRTSWTRGVRRKSAPLKIHAYRDRMLLTMWQFRRPVSQEKFIWKKKKDVCLISNDLYLKNDWLIHQHFARTHLPEIVWIIGRKIDKFYNFFFTAFLDWLTGNPLAPKTNSAQLEFLINQDT